MWPVPEFARDDTACVAFLREHNLLDESTSPCHRCGSPMNNVQRRNRRGEFYTAFRCTNRLCQTYRSARTNSPFFSYSDVNDRLKCNLKLHHIVKLIYLWSNGVSINAMAKATGHDASTVIGWARYLRGVCGEALRSKGMLSGTPQRPVLIDTPVYIGNAKKKCASDEGSWVFGLMQGAHLRYFIVDNVETSTLTDIIKQHVTAGSSLHNAAHVDMKSLADLDYNMLVEDSKWELDTAWLSARDTLLKRMRNRRLASPQTHLDEAAYRQMHRDRDLFLQILSDIRLLHRP